MRFPCSPSLKTEDVVYFPRLCDKIRLHAAGELAAEYHASLGQGFDLATCQFLGVEYAGLATVIRDGAGDVEALQWARQHGKFRPDYELKWWQSYMMTYGFRDDLAERLRWRKEESGLNDRTDIQTFFDYIDADEGRLPQPTAGSN